jgi:hypothetical protein
MEIMKMASKKTRFEVFKRDSFTCQYCGKTPPEVVLEIDHIDPKSNGGSNDINNYITACFECNRGKSDRLLTDVPDSVKLNIKRIKEKRLQVEEYQHFLNQQELSLLDKCIEVEECFMTYYPNKEFSERFTELTLKRLCNLLPTNKVVQAMKKACLHYEGQSQSEETIKYFCGICWNWIKRPETRDW